MDDITLQMAQRGDREAQSRLLSAMQDHWFRFCLAQLRDPHRAEDATQETAIRVLQSLVKFDGRSSLKTWSFGIALNVCRESRRRTRRDGAADVADVEPAAITDDRNESADDARAIRAAIDALPDRQREVVTLRYFEAMSVEQTASAMACAEGTVKATLFAALKALRRRMKVETND